MPPVQPPSPDFIEAALVAAKMIIHGIFALTGGVFSYFYQVYTEKVILHWKQFLLWIAMAFGVGMGFGEFIQYTPSYIHENSYGALFVAGAFWRSVLEYAKSKIALISKSK